MLKAKVHQKMKISFIKIFMMTLTKMKIKKWKMSKQMKMTKMRRKMMMKGMKTMIKMR
jgi:hypothetical protein